MNKVASELFLLTTNLSQLKSRDQIVRLFFESIPEIFANYSFKWFSENEGVPEPSLPICTRTKTYGHIQFEKTLLSNVEQYALFQNATQLMAILLERLEQEELLSNQKILLQHLVDEKTNHLVEKQDELNKINEEFATINEELIETNKWLLALNEQLQSEITERKKAEEELLQSEEKFKNVFEHASVGKSITSIDGHLKVNKAFCDIVGYTFEELSSKKWRDITYPEDIEFNQQMLQSILKGEKKSADWQKRYIHKNGNIIWVSISTSLQRDDKGTPLFYITTINDITVQKLMQEELLYSEQLFSNVFFNSPVAITITSRGDGKIVEANKTFLNNLEFTRDEVVGKSIMDLGVFYDPGIREKLIDGLIKNGFVSDFECSFRSKTGKISVGLMSMSFIQYKGKPHQLTTVIDITERKKAESILHDSERLLNESQRISGIGSYTLDILTGVWFGSEFLNEIFGIDASDDHSVDGWLSIIHPEDQAMMANYFANEVIIGKGRFDKEYRIVAKNTKQERWLHGVGELEFGTDGNQIKMIGTIQDITDRKKADDELRKLLRAVEQSPDSIIITNTNGEIEYANPAILHLSGYTNEELIGKNPRIFSSGEKTKEEYKILWDMISSGNVWQGEFHNKKKNGELYWESATISPVVNDLGKITHFLAVREDITEKKRLALELIEAKEHAEESDRLKSSFLANMSHEIRTPMNSIMGFASLLPEEESKELMCQYANIIVQNSEQLVSLIDSIVMYSKLQSGLFANKPVQFEVHRLLNDIQQSFNLPVYQQGVTLKNECSICERTQIYSDYDKLRQVIANLIVNAFKYTHKGEIILGCNPKEDWFEFYIKDTGIGIPEKDLDHVFERFYRGSNIDEAKSRGTGLGLCIVKELVEMLGGNIWVVSEVGKGSTFYFTIPQKSNHQPHLAGFE